MALTRTIHRAKQRQLQRESSKELLGYNATVSTDKRQRPKTTTKHEDKVLTKGKRKALIGTAREIQRNLAVLSWTVAKHVGYMSGYEYRCQTGKPGIDRKLERLVKRYSQKTNCDVTKRHDLDQLVALVEGRRISDGDILVHFCSEGRIELIESDKVTKPNKWPNEQDTSKESLAGRTTDHGLVLDEYGAVEHYCVCKYDKKGALVFNQFIEAKYIEHMGYFGRYDQTRGISPLAAALNSSQDLGELQEYVLQKIKNDALQGFVVSRQGSEPLDSDLEDADGVATEDASEAEGETSPTTYELPKGTGSFMYDLDDGDKLELLVSGTPNANLEGFLNHTIHQILMSLEVPYCFYDASKTNYKSYVAARYDYNASLKRKRKPLTQLLDRITDWRIRYWAAYDRELIDALEKEELTVGDVIDGSEWLAVDLPPVSRYEELKADAMEVSLGLSSRQEICRKRGKRFDKVIEDLAKEQELASDSGVILSSGLQPGGASVNEIIEKLEELEDNKGDS